MRRKENTRLTFLPSVSSAQYFDDLCRRLTVQSRLGIRVTQREAFDRMVEFAKIGEESLKARTVPWKVPDKSNPILTRP